MTREEIKQLAEASKLEFTEQEFLQLEKELNAAVLKKEFATISSNSMRIDGIRFLPSADGCETIDELYKKTRTNYFDWEAKKQIMLGVFLTLEGNYEKHFGKEKQETISINDLRVDEVEQSLSRDDVFMLAPNHDFEYFIVPKVVE